MKNQETLISVIVPIYNTEKYLNKCISSIINQTYRNLEIILVEDGSTDDSYNICKSYQKKDNRIKLIHISNGGVSNARNIGIQHCNGEYISFVDSDDFIDETYIEYLYMLINKYKTKMSIAQHRIIYNNKCYRDFGKVGDEIINAKTAIKRMLYFDIIDTSTWGKLYHKTLFENIKFPTNYNYEDIATTYSFFINSNQIAVGYLSKYNYIVNKNSIINSKFNIKKFDLITMTDKMAYDVESMFPDLKDAVISRKVHARFATLNSLLNNKKFKNERKEIVQYIKLNKRNILKNINIHKKQKVEMIVLCFNIYVYILLIKVYHKIKYML